MPKFNTIVEEMDYLKNLNKELLTAFLASLWDGPKGEKARNKLKKLITKAERTIK